MSQGEVLRAWDGIYSQVLVMLENEGRLTGIQMGQKIVYPYSQLIELFGEPVRPECLRYLRPCYDEHAA